ncbi:hypothetical protein NST77_16825 [Niallia sp. FSL W8-0177]
MQKEYLCRSIRPADLFRIPEKFTHSFAVFSEKVSRSFLKEKTSSGS